MGEWKPPYITPLCSTSGVRDNCVARSSIGFPSMLNSLNEISAPKEPKEFVIEELDEL